jgi:hypothetical protein
LETDERKGSIPIIRSQKIERARGKPKKLEKRDQKVKEGSRETERGREGGMMK